MINLRSTLAASSMLLLGASAASAADLYNGSRGSLKDGSPALRSTCAGDRFAGAYIGATAGVTNMHSKWTEVSADNNVFTDSFLGGHSVEDDGFSGGVAAGYNLVRCNFLLGVEGDYNFASLGKETVYNAQDGTGGVGITNTMHNYATLRGRMGVVRDATLYYATGGFAWADLHHAVSDNYPGVSGLPHFGISGAAPDFSGWKLGYVVGGGLEHAFTDRVTFKGEALYMDFGKRNYSFIDQAVPADTYTFSNSVNAFTARVGLNIKLGSLARGCDDCAPLK